MVIIPITKNEALALSKMGVKFHDGISTSFTKHKKYYLSETFKNLKMLRELRAGGVKKDDSRRKNKRVGV